MNENDAPTTPPEQEKPKSTNPNELEFEMTPEQEAEYVEQILKTGNYTPPAADEPATPPSSGAPGEPEAPKEPEAPAEPKAPEPKEPETPQEPAKPEASSEVTAPQTDDLWIEVEQVVTDDLGEETTKTVKLVYDPSDPASFIPDDFTAKNTKQLAEIMDAKAEMAKIYEGRQAEFDKAEAAKNVDQQEKDLLASWDREIDDLVKAGILEAPKLKADDPKYREDDSVKKVDSVFEFMTSKNEERSKEGLPPISSFSLALTMFEGDANRKAAEEVRRKQDEDTKRKGAMVGGGSAASGGTADQVGYVAGSHQNIYSVPVLDD